LLNFEIKEDIDICYFDAFSFDTQPEMWSEFIFKKIFDKMNANGILVTYSAKGIVKQNLRKVGFDVKRLKGFKKRHIIQAKKIEDK
jgi:tRNA U34 5-methylaminomethyl-2-thiouridine-forming methyltransferase MnmC